MLKILVLNTLYPPNVVGGAELSVETLVEMLRIEGFDTRVISSNPDETKSSFSTVNGSVYFKYSNIYWSFDGKYHGWKAVFWHVIDSYNLLGFFRVRKCIKNFKPDVFITNNLQGFSALSWLAAYRQNTPVIHILRDYGLISIDPSMTKHKNNRLVKLFNFMMRWHYHKLARKLTYLTGISNFVLQAHLEKIKLPTVKSKTIYNGITCNPFTYMNRECKSKIRIGYIGRLSEEKGVQWLLANIDLLQLNFDFSITLAGTGPLEKKLKEQYPKHKFIGKVKQREFFEKIDLLVVPSQWDEPFGRIIIEAYSFGIPVVYACRGGIPELIYPKHRQVLGYEDSDTNGLQKALNNIYDVGVDSEITELIQYSSKFSPQNCVKQYIELINTCIKTHSDKTI